jgi:3-methyladenine DNA glycosylase AlkD
MNLINIIRDELKRNADEKTQLSGKTFFKEEVKLYGVKTGIVTKIAKEHFKRIQEKSKKEIFELCELLWQSGYMEESFIACQWSYLLCKRYEQRDFSVFEKWIKEYVSNWASCDTFCNHTVGTFLEMYPGYVVELKKWAKLKQQRWMKRAAAVSLIIPAKKGLFLKDIFDISDLLMFDKDDLVQKGYGWMLKAASHAHQLEVFDYVFKNKQIMPRTALRYAIEKMPTELKERAMER